jgi:hypothetical protein
MRAVMALVFTDGPSRTLTVCSEATMPVMGGVALGVGVVEGVGVIGVLLGVKVKVGSGVRLGTGVAVKRGVILTIGASVLVGTVSACCSGPPVKPLQAVSVIKPSKSN